MSSGLFWAGLTNGLLGGYQAADQIVARGEERERRATLDEANRAANIAEMGIKREDQAIRKQQIASENENRAATLDLARQGLGLKKQEFTRKGQQQQVENTQADAKLKLLQGEENRKAQLFNIELASKQRENATKARLEKLPQLEAVLSRWQTPGAEASPDDVAIIRDVTGVDPTKFTDPGTMGRLKQTFEAVREGKLDPNSPQAIEVAKTLYDPYLQRGIGEPHKAPDGRIFTVESKSWSGLVPIQDQPGKYGVAVHVLGKDDKGQPVDYIAPATVHGTSDDADDALLLDDHTLETPAALATLIHHRYTTNPSVKAAVDASMQSVRGPKDRQTESTIELNRARADEAKAKAANAGKGKPADIAKIHGAKMDDVEKYLIADFGDGLGNINKEQRAQAQQIRSKAGAALRTNTDLTAEEAYDQAMKEVGNAGGMDDAAPPPAKVPDIRTQAKQYAGPRPWLKTAQ
jgi:hypothetical protein